MNVAVDRELALVIGRFVSLVTRVLISLWTATTQEKHHRSLPVSETYVLTGLQPNTLYYIWLAAKSKRGEGATTPPIPVRTDQYGK